jgi:hypothetical protein
MATKYDFHLSGAASQTIGIFSFNSKGDEPVRKAIHSLSLHHISVDASCSEVVAAHQHTFGLSTQV